MTNVEEVKKREAELAQLREETKSQLLAEGKQIVDGLFEIGYDYELIEKNVTAARNGSGRTCSQCHNTGHTKSKCPELKGVPSTAVAKQSQRTV